MSSPSITITPTFERALAAMESGAHVFLTGRAGTGKSTLLRHFREHTKKKPVVLAPTGVAAVNVQGQTIHSFFGFGPDVTPGRLPKPKKRELYQQLSMIIIDEVSMVRADLLDAVDRFLRAHGPVKKRPFGGVQMIFIGDLYQLPPVVTSEAKGALAAAYATPYFFSAGVFDPQQRLLSDAHDFRMELIELPDVFRQRDEHFLSVLNRVRENTITQDDLAVLNARCQRRTGDPKKDGIVLSTTNVIADTINTEALARLRGRAVTFPGRREGRFQPSALPTAETLTLKIGAQIMMLSNDREGRWINGTLGTIDAMDDDAKDPMLTVTLETGDTVEVARHEWNMYAYTIDDAGALTAEPVGRFIQFPVRLAWAVTIHKGQGKTFERVHIDIGRGTFAPGQLYVALSRATTLEGMTLERPIEQRHVWTDANVVKFLTEYSATVPT